MLNRLVTWIEVDLDAIAHNVRALKSHVGPAVELMAVVKGNAYGHGAMPVARAMLEAGATRPTATSLLSTTEIPSGQNSKTRHGSAPCAKDSTPCSSAIVAGSARLHPLLRLFFVLGFPVRNLGGGSSMRAKTTRGHRSGGAR